MAGAAVLAAEAVLRGGAGYVVVVAPGSIATELTVRVPSAVLSLCGDRDRACLEASDVDQIATEIRRAQAVAIGPGLGTHGATQEFLKRFLSLVEKSFLPVVFDADALNSLAQLATGGNLLSRLLPTRSLLTPHPGEAARLLRWHGPSEVQKDRNKALQKLLEETAATVLLKGAPTLVANPRHQTWVNTTGNSGLATAGSGDVLTGLCAALLARGLMPWEAAKLGAHLHGLAGDLGAAELGEDSLLATDLMHYIPPAFQHHKAGS